MKLWRCTDDSPTTINGRGGFGPRYFQPNHATTCNIASVRQWVIAQCASPKKLRSAFDNVRGTAQSDMACSTAANTGCGGVSGKAYRYALNVPVLEYTCYHVSGIQAPRIVPNLEARVYMNNANVLQATIIAIGIKYGTKEVAFVTKFPKRHIANVYTFQTKTTKPWVKFGFGL